MKLFYRKALGNWLWHLLSVDFKVKNKMNNVTYAICFLNGQFGSVHI